MPEALSGAASIISIAAARVRCRGSLHMSCFWEADDNSSVRIRNAIWFSLRDLAVFGRTMVLRPNLAAGLPLFTTSQSS